MKTKKTGTICSGMNKFSFNVNNDNIYIGKIMKCTSYYSKMEEAFKNGCTDYEGNDRKKITSHFVRNAILVKLCYNGTALYVELENFDLEKLKQRIKIFPNNVVIYIEDDELILLDEPFEVDMEYVDPKSVKKFEYKKGIATGNSSKRNEKVKSFVRELKKGA